MWDSALTPARPLTHTMSWLKAAILSCFSECRVVFVLVFTSSFVYLNYNLLVIYQTSKNAPDAWKTNITIDFVKKTVSRLKCGPAEDTCQDILYIYCVTCRL